MTDSYTQEFGKFNSILDSLTASFKPILDAGPNQEGFSGAEKTALNTQATEGVASNYNKALTATNQNISAAGGGNAFLPFGGADEAKENVALASAQQQSAEENQITKADYATGRANYFGAASALGSAAGMINPT